MRRIALLFLAGLMISLPACSSSRHGDAAGVASDIGAPAPVLEKEKRAPEADAAPAAKVAAKSSRMSSEDTFAALRQQGQQGLQGLQEHGSQVPLDAGGAAQGVERKVIQNAEMTIETDSPNEGQRKIAAIADKHNGFVVISESKQNEAVSQTVASTVVNVVVRVPARQFEAAIAEIRGVGGRILHEKTSGQDVTEEYIDLEARIRTKRALEAQFLEIMKQAHKISDALEVQTQLADVRAEIERLEGRRRFIENQSALSTINITLHTPTPVVAAVTRGFLYDLKAAFGDGVGVGTEIFLGIIRFVIVLIPVTLFILAPAWFVFKWLRKRVPWPAKEIVASVVNPTE
ncbi:MAG: DUF4349 domain-containing protein [Chloracidobacterium sp.]|nr:DUF4349 domain-containing protein [Chloracidobacterium sp.]